MAWSDIKKGSANPAVALSPFSLTLANGATAGYIWTCQSEDGVGAWEAGSGGGGVNSVTAADGSIVIGGTMTNPTVGASGAFNEKDISTSGNLSIGTFTLPAGAMDSYVLTSDGSGNGTWQAAGGGGAVSSVTAGDGTVTVSPTTGSVVVEATGTFGAKSISCDSHQIASDGNGNFYIGNSGTISDAPIQLFGTTGPGTSAGTIEMTGQLSVGAGIHTGVNINNDPSSFDNGAINTDGTGGFSAVSLTTSEFKLTTSPVDGYVLTSDGSGNGTWMAPAESGLTVTPSMASGIWSSAQAINMFVAKAGNSVTLSLAAALSTANASDNITLTSLTLPDSTWFPSTNYSIFPTYPIMKYPVTVTDNNIDIAGEMVIEFGASSSLIVTIYAANGASFSGTGISGFGNITVSWLADV